MSILNRPTYIRLSFFAWQPESEVMVGEPDPLARVVFWVIPTMVVSLFYLLSELFLEMNMSLVPLVALWILLTRRIGEAGN